MKKFSKAQIIAVFLTAVLVAGGLGAYIMARKIVPTILSANLESILSQTTGQPVAIGKSSMQLFPGINIGVRNVRVGTPEKPLINAHRVKIRISLWHALFGQVRPSHVYLENPVIWLDKEALEKFKLKQEKGEAPPVDIQDGVIRLPGQDRRIVIESLNGEIKQDGASLKAVVLGGKTRLKAKNTGSGWKGTLTSTDMDISRISPRLKGLFGVDLEFDLSGNKTVSSLSITGGHLRFPWSNEEIPTFLVKLGATGNDQELTFREISVMTPLVEISGTGTIRNIMKGTGASIALNLRSGIFDYEKALAYVPTKDLDPWLSQLLTAQVRGGKSRVTAAHYAGTVQELISFSNVLDHIHVVQEIMGQSYAAGAGTDRITGITGQVVYSRGGVFLTNLRGRMHGSEIQKVNISFPGVFLPYWFIGVDVKLDMAAHDFLDMWTASGMPGYVIDLFSSISQVKAGRLKGEANFYWNQSTGKAVQARGRVDLENCAYTWGSQIITGHSGSAVSASYDAPLEITSRMNVGSRVVRSLSIVLTDPFWSMQSTFAAYVDGLVNTEGFSMDKGTTVLIKGKGTGMNISASADVSAESMTLFGTVYRMKGKPIKLSARLKGPLAPRLALAFTGEMSGIPSGRLGIKGIFDDQQTRINLKGLLPLDQFEAIQAQKAVPLSGRLSPDLAIVTTRATAVNGSLECRGSLLPVTDTFLKLDGRVGVAGAALSGKKLLVTKDKMTFTLNDWSLDLSGKPLFKGDVTMVGLSLPLPEGQAGAPRNFKDFTAQGVLKIRNLDFYGIKAEDAQARVALKNGVANFSDLSMQGKSGQISGTLAIGPAGLLSYDTWFSLKNVSINRFLERVSSEKGWVYGNMNLDGRLFGKPDSINGKIRMVSRDGKLKRYVLISRVFGVLNVYKIIKTRDLELQGRNFPYNTLAGTFTIKDNLAHTEDFFLDSNSLQFSAVGDYSLKTEQINAVLGMQPFESIDKAIHAIPLIGWVLTGDKGQLFIVSMKVTGNIDDPDVKIETGKTLSDPVKNSLMRALKLPSELIKDSQNLLNGGKKTDKPDASVRSQR